MAGAADRVPHCPRCGYDLRGTTATWGDAGACPLDGTCTECGLTFRWVDVFDPTREEPQWCVEYAPGKVRPMAKAMVGTFARSWLPWVFWKRLRLHHEVGLRRIAMYLLALLIVPATLLYVCSQTAVAVVVRYQVGAAWSTGNLPAAIASTERMLAEWLTYEDWRNVPAEDRYGVLLRADYPFEEGVADADPLQIMLSQDEWDVLWRCTLDRYERLLGNQRELLANPPEVQITYARAVFEAIFTPLKRESSGQINAPAPYAEIGRWWLAYPAPRNLYEELQIRLSAWGWGRTNPWWATQEVAVPTLVTAAAWLVLLLSYPLTFILLPITRRRAKVRWRHFGRITVYSISVPIVLLHLAAVVFVSSLFLPAMGFGLRGLAVLIPTLLPLPILLTWWYCAIRWHLRLPHPLAVTVILAVLNGVVMLPLIGIAVGLLVTFLDLPL